MKLIVSRAAAADLERLCAFLAKSKPEADGLLSPQDGALLAGAGMLPGSHAAPDRQDRDPENAHLRWVGGRCALIGQA
jgi:hypothetical protein